MKLLFCTLAAIVLVGVFTVHQADAACWWNGWGWRCWHPYWHPYWHAHWGWHPWWGWHHHWGYWHRW